MTTQDYVLGESDQEHRCLIMQAHIVRSWTERFFRAAGIAPGMSVFTAHICTLVPFAVTANRPSAPNLMCSAGNGWPSRRPVRTSQSHATANSLRRRNARTSPFGATLRMLNVIALTCQYISTLFRSTSGSWLGFRSETSQTPSPVIASDRS